MPKPNPTRKAKAEALFNRAAKEEERGKLRSAFPIAARRRQAGTHRLPDYWYKRAYRNGCSPAAHNLGVLWRNERQWQRSLDWFHKAARRGEVGSNIDIAKFYLNKGKLKEAVPYLKKVTPKSWVSEADLEEAQQLLKRTLRELKE